MNTNPTKLTALQYQDLILTKIKKTYEEEKGKKFINHLVNGFLDPSLVTVPAAIQDPEPKCAISGKKLLSQVGILELVSDDEMKKTVSYIAKLGYDPEDATIIHPVKELIDAEFDGYEPLISSTSSNKYLGLTAYQMLQKFAADEMAAGNGHMKSMLGFIERKNKKASNKSLQHTAHVKFSK